MRGYNTYRHISCLDIDMYVHKITYHGPTYFKARVTLLNRYSKITYETLTVIIQRDQLPLWNLVSSN